MRQQEPYQPAQHPPSTISVWALDSNHPWESWPRSEHFTPETPAPTQGHIALNTHELLV